MYSQLVDSYRQTPETKHELTPILYIEKPVNQSVIQKQLMFQRG